MDSTGMSRKEFAEYFGIPYRTLQDWELGNRSMPEYLFRLMRYKLLIEGKCSIEQRNGQFVHKSFEERLVEHNGEISVCDFDWGTPVGREEIL